MRMIKACPGFTGVRGGSVCRRRSSQSTLNAVLLVTLLQALAAMRALEDERRHLVRRSAMSKRSMEQRFSEADEPVSSWTWSCDMSYHISLSGVVN
jgi:hypothetical protein